MSKENISEKTYHIKTKQGTHLSEKINDDGSIAAIQFDHGNKLQGPVDLVEADEDNFNIKQVIVEDYIAPVVADALSKVLTKIIETGFVATGHIMSKVVIPAVKEKSGKLIKKARSSYETQRATRIDKKRLKNEAKQKSKDESVTIQSEKSVMHTTEEIETILNNMKYAALYIAAGIRELSNTVVANDGCDPEKVLFIQNKLNELSSDEIICIIDFMLNDSNRDMLDLATIQLFEAFRNKALIIDGESIPISKCLSGIEIEQ